MLSERSYIIVLIAVVAVVQAAFTGYQIAHKNLFLGPDSFEYRAQADNIRKAASFYSGDLTKPVDIDLYTKRPPIYPLFLAAVKSIVNSDIAVIVLQTLMATGTVLLTAFLMRMMGVMPSRRAMAVLVACLVVTPSHFLYPNFIMTETLLQAVVLLMTASLFAFISTREERYLYAYQLLVVIAMYTKPVFYLFAIPSALFIVWLAIKGRALRYVLSAAIPILFIAAMMGWNHARTGYAQYSSIQTINILYYNTYYFLVKTKGDAEAKRAVAEIAAAAEREGSYAARTKYIHRECGKILMADMPRYALFHARGMLNFFLDPGRFDLHNFFSLTSDNTGLLYHFSSGGYRGAIDHISRQPAGLIAAVIIILLGNIIKLAGVALFFFMKIRLEFRVFAVGLILYIAGATGPLGATRFAVPVLPVMFICLAALLSRVMRAQEKA